MDLLRARRLLELPEEGRHGLTAEALRKQYLRLALRVHPDKNPGDPAAGERFSQLGAAHAALLASVVQGEAAGREEDRLAALLALLLRALQGEEIDAQLAALGEYRPPAEFGVDMAVRFDARVPPADGGMDDSGSDRGSPADVREAFREAFHQDGLTDEGDPVSGYELPLEREEF